MNRILKSKQRKIRSLKFSGYLEAVKMNTPFVFHENSIFNLIRYNAKCVRKIELEGAVIVFQEGVNRQISRDEITGIIRMSEKIHVWSTGGMFRGKYFDKKNETTYSNKSLSVEIFGSSTVEVVNAAENIAFQLNQNGVMVKTYLDGRIFLVDTKI